MDLETREFEKTEQFLKQKYKEGLSKLRLKPALYLDILPETEEGLRNFMGLDAKDCLFAQKENMDRTQASSLSFQENLDLQKSPRSRRKSKSKVKKAQTPKKLIGKRPSPSNEENEAADSPSKRPCPQHKSKKAPENLKNQVADSPSQGRCTRSQSKNNEGDFQEISLKQSGQNELKNCPGLIASQIKRLCEKDTDIFKAATSSLTSQRRITFRIWTATLEKDSKTWSTLSDWFHEDLEFGKVFVRMVFLFLSSSKFQKQYEDWLNQSKMTQQTKETLRGEGNKAFLVRKFWLATVKKVSKEISKSRKQLNIESGR